MPPQKHYLVTDDDGVRDFRNMRKLFREVSGQGAHRSQERGQSHPITVRFVADVPAEELAPQPARVMRLINGTWTPTETVFPVRNLTGSDISAEITQVAVPNVDRLGYAVIGGGSGGGGGAAGCGCCVSLLAGNIAHPHLPTGKDDAASQWSLSDGCGDVITPVIVPTSDGKGTVELHALGGNLVYETTNHQFVYDVSASVAVKDNAGTDQTLNPAVTATATITMDWSSDPAWVEFDFDATGLP